MRAAVRSIDGLGLSSRLTARILDRLGRSRPAIASWVKVAKPGDYAVFAPAILSDARDGDEVARVIVDRAIEDVSAIAWRLIELGAARLCLLGGMAEALIDSLPLALRAHFAAPIADAMDGAVMAARRAAGLPAQPGGGDG